jgi:hypothetical protein
MSTRILATMITLGVGVGLSMFACQSSNSSNGGYGGELPNNTTSSTTTTSSTSSSTTSHTTTTSTTSSTTSTTTTTTTTVSCPDTNNGEPNNNPSQAKDLGYINDADPTPKPTLHGVIAGSSDVDWYTYRGNDVQGLAVVDPERTFNPNVNNVRMCAFYWCVNGILSHVPDLGSGGGGGGDAGPAGSCPAGTEIASFDFSGVTISGTQLGETVGCCTLTGTTTFHLGGQWPAAYWPLSCPLDAAGDDTMQVMLRFDAYSGAAQDMCVPYTVEYHF